MNSIDSIRRTQLCRTICESLAIVIATVCMFQSAFAQTDNPHAVAPLSVLKKSYTPASVLAKPGLKCNVHAVDSAAESGNTVYTDSDGYARFHAVRAGAGEGVQRLSMDCVDSAGKTSSYPIDLSSPEVFQARPLNVMNERGTDRPALKGDPLSYTQSQLIRNGYGIRPDPVKTPKAYAQWLAVSTLPLRSFDHVRPLGRAHTLPLSGSVLKTSPLDTKFGSPASTFTPSPPLSVAAHTVVPQTQPWWVGSVLTGAPNYVWIQGTFNVPWAIPGAAGTTNTEMTIWDGVGGFGSNALIQGGVTLRTTPTAAFYSTLREYCCGDTNENDNGIQAFTPNPGDRIYSQNWYCDKDGNINIYGGYGCTLMVDQTTQALLNCTQSTGSPCASVAIYPGQTTLGSSADFIIENQSPQVGTSNAFPVFAPTVDISGAAFSTATNSFEQTVSNDPTVILLTESTNVPSHIVVSVDQTDDTYFTWISVWSLQQQGIGGGTSNGPSLAVFQGRLYAAWKGIGDDSRMFWSSFDGANWTPQQQGIGGGTSSGPSLAVFNGRLYAGWKGIGDDSRMFWSSFDGANWTPQQQGIGGGSSNGPALAVFQDRLYAGWKGIGDDTRMFWSSFDGTNWTLQQQGIGGGTSNGPALAVFNNRLYAGWKGLGNDSRMFWSSFDGANWTPQQQGIGGGTSNGPTLAVFQGRLYAGWKGIGDDSRMFWSSFDGANWTPQQQGVGGGTSSGPSFAVFNNQLYAGWKGIGDDSRMFWSAYQ